MWQYVIPAISAIVVAALTSGGLWALVAKRADKNDAERKMLVGLAHDRIVHLGMVYVQRGHITQDEYENLNDYLYAPYEKMGGNGSAKRVMEEVRRLPIRKGEPACPTDWTTVGWKWNTPSGGSRLTGS